MLHVGLDLHKRFSTVATMDGNGNVQLGDKLYHDDRARMRKFFGDMAGNAVVRWRPLGTGTGCTNYWRTKA